MRKVAIALPLLLWLGIVWCRVGEPQGSGSSAEAPPARGRVDVVAPLANAGGVLDPGAAETVRLAYRLVIDRERASLAGVAELRGRFKVRRTAREAYPGMIRCSLVDAGGMVLAEELLAEPDRLCGVIGGAEAMAVGVQRGPVMCQARLPKASGAVALEVRRVTGDGDMLLGRFSTPE